VLHTLQCVDTHIDPQKWAFSVKKPILKQPILPENPVKKPAINLPAGFINKTWVFQALYLSIMKIS
jgi:hypothetical protein